MATARPSTAPPLPTAPPPTAPPPSAPPPPAAVPVVETTGLTKRYGSVTALDGLDLVLREGVTGLVGANGAGKSTLLKLLLGLARPTSGSCRVLGFDTATQADELRAHVGYMPEHDCLPPDVSATELVVHLAVLAGLPRTAARERTADALRHVGLFEERYRPVGGYSTGMRQRVKLAQALVHDPKLVLLDEPTNGLDPTGRDEMLELVRRVRADFGISVVVTSHLLGELERVCDAVAVVEGGALLRHTTTAAVTGETGAVVVEVADGAPALAAALADGGLVVREQGRLLEVDVETPDDLVAVRDAVARLGLGLLRLERRRHRMAEIFSAPATPEATRAA